MIIRFKLSETVLNVSVQACVEFEVDKLEDLKIYTIENTKYVLFDLLNRGKQNDE